MTKVKICGITNPEDALYAAELSAAFIGMIFYPKSPRFITNETAFNIVSSLPDEVIPVGVFVNPKQKEIISAIEVTGIKAVQIHGTTDFNKLRELNIIQIRAFAIDDSFDFNAIPDEECDYTLLDNYVNGQYGGTGKTFNWMNIPPSINRAKLILSGGLKPENVGSAVKTVKPAVIDVSSGVESSPGIKDGSKIREFFKSVENADSGF